MRRWDPLNERQLGILRRVGSGDDLSNPEDAGLRTSARALQARGLVKVSRRVGGWQAATTRAGDFYLKHGHHPDHPDTPSPPGPPAARSARLTPAAPGPDTPVKRRGQRSPAGYSPAGRRRPDAARLIRRLESENLITIDHPDNQTVTELRRTIDFAKRNGMVPPGRWIEKRRDLTGNLIIELMTGDPPNKRVTGDSDLPPVPVPSRLRSLHPVVGRLREDDGRLVMPASRRRRCLIILQALAAEAERRGHKVTDEPVSEHRRTAAYTYMGHHRPSRYSRREGEIRIGIGDFSYAVTLSEESPQSADPDRSERLVLEVTPYRAQGRRYRWADRKTRKVEDHLAAVLRELETRAVEDAQREIEEEKARAQRRVRWEQAMNEARREAYKARDIAALRDQVTHWHEAQQIARFCDALAERLAGEPADDPDRRLASEWLTWARAYAHSLDPLRTLPRAPERSELEPGDLEPYLEGWSPYGPEDRHQWPGR